MRLRKLAGGMAVLPPGPLLLLVSGSQCLLLLAPFPRWRSVHATVSQIATGIGNGEPGMNRTWAATSPSLPQPTLNSR